MTRFVRAAVFAAVVSSAAGSVGCNSAGGGHATADDRPGVQARYASRADIYWPDRYKGPAREAVLHPHETQVRNALITDATIGNYLFEPQTDKLTEAGRQRLDYLARRGLCADGHLYLQTARDLPYDAANPNKLVADRADLDGKRGQAVLAYMGTQPGGKQYDITPLDPRDTNMSVIGPSASVRGLNSMYRSGITGAAGLPLTGVGGGPAPGAPGVPNSGTPGAGGGVTVNSGAPSGGTGGSSSGGAGTGGR